MGHDSMVVPAPCRVESGLAKLVWLTQSWSMKSKAAVFILLAVCVVLAILYVTRTRAYRKQTEEQTNVILSLSNELAQVNDALVLERQRASETAIAATNAISMFQSLSNQLAVAQSVISNLTGLTNKLFVQLQAVRAELTNREARVAELEARTKSLDDEAAELRAAITNLNAQIRDVQAKLAAAEGDKTFLQNELKRLMAEKAELERKYNDLEQIRAQYKLLKAELARSKRLQWLRKGELHLTEKRGVEWLAPRPQFEAPAVGRPADLNVEIDAQGNVRVIPPLKSSSETNRPGTK